MILSDKHQFAEMLRMTAEMYSKPSPAAQLIKMYWAALEKYEISEVRSALNIHIQNPDVGQFFPKPADIIRNIDGTTESKAQLAWTQVQKAIGSVGGCNSVVFDDAIVHAVVDDMGGWVDLCLGDEEELVFKQREFEKRYRAYMLTPPLAYPKKLVGSSEMYNQTNGFDIDAPLVIGAIDKAALVYKHGGASTAKSAKAITGNRLLQIANQVQTAQLGQVAQ
ncbi:MAG: DUF6475 domain-containing protein [Vibrio sp.]